jgi:ferredoxin
MIKKIKFLPVFLPVFFILFSLAGCAKKDTTDPKPVVNNSDNKDDSNIVQTIADKKLVIAEHKCSGCGKCAQIDPEHFVYDRTMRKATVISTKNLNSPNLTVAVSICRDRAIELI